MHTALSATVEAQKKDFQKEYEDIEKERKRLLSAKRRTDVKSKLFRKITVYEARNNAKELIIQEQERVNHNIIDKMKQDYLLLNEAREKEEDDLREKQRQKLQHKIEERKHAKAVAENAKAENHAACSKPSTEVDSCGKVGESGDCKNDHSDSNKLSIICESNPACESNP